jgi:release factor glutamine methyltransferase
MNIITFVEKQLQDAGYSSARPWQEACWLAEHVTGYSAAVLLTRNCITLTNNHHGRLAQLIHTLTAEKKPLAYVLEWVPFCSLRISIKNPVLIPRPETEEWVTNLILQLQLRKKPPHILDIGTGSGCIALALAHALPHAEIIATDISDQALALARINQEQLKLYNISFIKANLFPPKRTYFDVIVSNPPYISESEYETLQSHITLWEDRRALVAEDNGQAIIKKIIERTRDYLIPDGLLVIEIGSSQADIYTFMQSCGYTDVQVMKDFAQHNRVLMGRYETDQEFA